MTGNIREALTEMYELGKKHGRAEILMDQQLDEIIASSKRCRLCGGTGRSHTMQPELNCKHCKGTGKEGSQVDGQ